MPRPAVSAFVTVVKAVAIYALAFMTIFTAISGPVVIEVNPRLTVAYAELSRRGGRNLAAELLAAHRVPGFDGDAGLLRACAGASS